MPAFTNAPPPDAAGPSLPLLRTPAARPLEAICTSHDLIGCYTHFWHGHTVPCEGPDCQAHAEGIPYRWHAYLSAFRPSDGLHFLFESTAQASENLVLYRKANGTLRGCVFKAARHNMKPNGRVSIRTRPADLSKLHLPKAPNLELVLAVLWNLPSTNVEPSGLDPERQIPTVHASSADNPMHSPPPATETGDQLPAGVQQIRETINAAFPTGSTPAPLTEIRDTATGRIMLGQKPVTDNSDNPKEPQ